MSTHTHNRVLQVTRWLIYLIMALIAFADAVLVLVGAVLPFYWTEAAAKIVQENPSLDSDALFPILYVVFALGIVIMGLVWTIMRKLLAIVNSVAEGDPFVLANAVRLKAIGWLMVAAQIIGIPLAFAARQAADLFGENNVDSDISLTGILAILLVFVLAGVFERGAEMREELEGTV